MILYIGNKLSRHGNTPTSVETLGALLAEEYDLVTVSDKRNRLLRLGEMLYSIMRYRKRIDCILIDTYSTSNFYYALLCGWLAKGLALRYIPILRGGNLPERLRGNPRLCRTLFENAWVNVAPSGYLYDVFEKAGYRVRYIPNSVEIADCPFSEREGFRPRLLYVRAFGRLYNPQMALRVLQKLLPRYPDASLCMVGPDRDGTLEETKALCRRLGLEKHVRFPGKLGKEEWRKLSKEYDIFLNTTNVDNTPVSLIEAMALGLPVVTTNVGGIPYLIEDGVDGWTVQADDTETMAESIVQILDHPEEAQKRVHAARKKVERFDWGIVKDKWNELLGEK